MDGKATSRGRVVKRGPRSGPGNLVCPDTPEGARSCGRAPSGVFSWASGQAGSARRRRDAHRQRGGVTAIGGDRLLGAGAAGREHPDGPVTRRGEEAEPAVLTQRNLSDELAVVVQQP